MYEIKNGILYKNGKKTFVLGESYYPSFHPFKYPVPPEGDRVGEMKKDLKLMADMGFNHVRFAALGEVALGEDGSLSVDTPFIDDMIREAEKNDISVSIRQQGFAVNLRGFENVKMIDWSGNEQQTNWFDFIRTTMTHEGILEDNRTYARGLAEHYARFDNVIGYQIYNEPHYPGHTAYDYHPCAVGAYRKWLVDKGILTEREAAHYQPPRGRHEQTPRMWALWRIFARDSLTAFLDNASDGSRTGSALPTFTCFTAAPIKASNYQRGCDVFANAGSMDIVGYTNYYHARGAEYYGACLHNDLCQCAAELEGKESWCVELDSRTYIPCSVYNRGTYAVLGSGCRGIVYYQWRGDCPVSGVPHPNSCGLVNYDGTKTGNYDNGAAVNRFIIGMNDLLMEAHRVHDGVGLLHSDYAAFMCDAMENPDREKREVACNSYVTAYTETYRRLREAGYNVSITDAAHLCDNRLGIKVLYVPSVSMLSPEEREAIGAFIKRGGEVFEKSYASSVYFGYRRYEERKKSYEEMQFDPCHTVHDVAELTDVKPRVTPMDPALGVQLLAGEGYTLAVLTNLSTVKNGMCARLRVHIPFEEAAFRAIDGERAVTVNGDEISVDITDGGILILR